MEITQASEISQMLSAILSEIKKQSRHDDDLWSTEEIADFLKLSRKSVQNHIVKTQTFPDSVPLPTGGLRWISKEVREWAKKRKSR